LINAFEPPKRSVPSIYYQSYLKYVDGVGWVLHEDWLRETGVGSLASWALRERFYCSEDANWRYMGASGNAS